MIWNIRQQIIELYIVNVFAVCNIPFCKLGDFADQFGRNCIVKSPKLKNKIAQISIYQLCC